MCYKMIIIYLNAPVPLQGVRGLIVTFLAFRSTNLFNRYTVHFMIFQVFVEFLVNAVILVSGTVFFVVKINFRFSVAIDTPAHA